MSEACRVWVLGGGQGRARQVSPAEPATALKAAAVQV